MYLLTNNSELRTEQGWALLSSANRQEAYIRRVYSRLMRINDSLSEYREWGVHESFPLLSISRHKIGSLEAPSSYLCSSSRLHRNHFYTCNRMNQSCSSTSHPHGNHSTGSCIHLCLTDTNTDRQSYPSVSSHVREWEYTLLKWHFGKEQTIKRDHRDNH